MKHVTVALALAVSAWLTTSAGYAGEKHANRFSWGTPSVPLFVFFDFTEPYVTEEGRKVVLMAANIYGENAGLRIDIVGHTDTAEADPEFWQPDASDGCKGLTPEQRQAEISCVWPKPDPMRLGMLRAQAIADILVADGVPRGEVFVSSAGTRDLLIETGPGVREPQNRFASILVSYVPTLAFDVQATSFAMGTDVAAASGAAAQYGSDTLLNAPPYTLRPNSADWQVEAPKDGRYHLWIRYAAAEPRPIDIYVNGKLAIKGALNSATGCWLPRCREWTDAGPIDLAAGTNDVDFSSHSVFPHLNLLRFVLSPVVR